MRRRVKLFAVTAIFFSCKILATSEKEQISDPYELDVAREINSIWDPMREILEQCRLSGENLIQCVCINMLKVRPLIIDVNVKIDSMSEWTDANKTEYYDSEENMGFLDVAGARKVHEIFFRENIDDICSTHNNNKSSWTASRPAV